MAAGSATASDQRSVPGVLPALLLALLLCVPSLFARGLLPPDESRYADVALAMRETGEWIVPQLHQKWYFEKGPAFFWAIDALEAVGVPLEWGPRAVSLLAALGLIGLLPTLARSAGLAPDRARRAGLILATAPLFAIYAQLGYIDLFMGFFVAAAAAAKLARDATPEGDRARGRWWRLVLLEGVAIGVALLTKGPVVLLFAFGLRIGAACARRDEGRDAKQRVRGRFDRADFAVFGIAVAIAAAWLVAAGRTTGWDYVRQITVGQIERRVGGTERKHHVPFGFQIGVVLVGGLPWSLLALGTVRGWAMKLKSKQWSAALRPPPEFAALVGWAVLPVVVIACLPSQQPHYCLPTLPAFALLAAEGLARPERLRKGAARAAAAIALAFAALLLTIAAAAPALLERARIDPALARRLGDDAFLRGAFALAGIGIVMAVFWKRKSGRTNPALRTLAGLTAFLLALPLIAWRCDEFMRARGLLEADAVRHAKRIVAVTGLRCSLRIASGLRLIEEPDGRPLEQMIGADPELICIEEREVLRRLGLLDRVTVVASGFLRGDEVLAVRGPLR